MANSGAIRWWFVTVVNNVCAVAVFVLLCLLTRTIHREFFSEEGRKKLAANLHPLQQQNRLRLPLVLIATEFVGLLYLFTLIWAGLRLILGDAFLSCVVTIRVAAPVFQATKSIFYGIFVHRIHTVYSGSIYAYPPRLLIFGYSLLFTSNSIIVICDALLPRMEQRSFGGSNKEFCVAVFPTWMSVMALLIDVIGSLSCLYLFTRPLRTMLADESAHQSCPPLALKMTRLATKYTLLTFIAVITTAANLVILALFNQVFLAPLDMVVNLSVFILLTKWYDDFFYGYCQWTFACLRCCYPKKTLRRVSTLDIGLEEEGEEEPSEVEDTPDRMSEMVDNNQYESDNDHDERRLTDAQKIDLIICPSEQ